MTKPRKFETSSGPLAISNIEAEALELLANARRPVFRMPQTCEKLARKGLAEYVGNRFGGKIRHYQITELGRSMWVMVVQPKMERI